MDLRHVAELQQTIGGQDLVRRLSQRRHQLNEVRDELGTELDLKTQARYLMAVAQVKAREGQVLAARGADAAGQRFAAVAESADLARRWRPLAALAAAGAVLVVLLRRLLRSNQA